MRFKVIYVPKGRALEYSDKALNLFKGCDHKCKYCFAALVSKKSREEFFSEVTIRDNLLQNIESDCKKLAGTTEKVLLCFICDPYCHFEADSQTTRKVLELFKQYNINFQVLTKGGTRATRDFDLYKPGDAFASTLTFLEDKDSLEWEPGAALPGDRLSALKTAHSLGIETWASLEPVVDPSQSLRIIEETHPFIDLYKVGTINYDELKNKIDWKDFGLKAIELLEKHNKRYYIKEDLKKFLT